MSDAEPGSIRDFASPGEYRRFETFVAEQLASGAWEEVPADPRYGPGAVYGGRWFRRVSQGDTWRLVPPDFPFRAGWEPVRRAPQSAG